MPKPVYQPGSAAKLIARQMRAERGALPPELAAQISRALLGSVSVGVRGQDPELTARPVVEFDHGSGELGVWRAAVERALGDARQLQFANPDEPMRCASGHRQRVDSASGDWGWQRCHRDPCGRFTLWIAGDHRQRVTTDLSVDEATFLDRRSLDLADVVRFLLTARRIPLGAWAETFPPRRGRVEDAIAELDQ